MAFSAVAFLAAMLCFGVLEGMALRMTGGIFEYPLDDAYIHLSMGEQIWAGGYGVNAGEYASASSSALYPVLLFTWAGTGVQRYLPLFWNVIGMGLSAWLWGAILAASGWGGRGRRAFGFVLAAVGPVAMLMVSAAYVGMEHTLHGAASLAILYGLIRHLQGRPTHGILLAGAFFAPMLRFEGLALVILAAGVLFITGARRQAALALVLGILPVLAFMGFLTSLGLEPLPSSITAKLLIHEELGVGLIDRLAGALMVNLRQTSGRMIAGYCVVIWGLLIMSRRLRTDRFSLLALILFLAGLAHLLLAQVGWLNRYEHYIIATLFAGFVALLPVALGRLRPALQGGVALLALAPLLYFYVPGVVKEFPFDARAILAQQRQMARFAQVYLKANVAVNDLGAVSWGNPYYVLDLFGLASAEARNKRINDPTPGWADDLAAQHHVPAAMIYMSWVGKGAFLEEAIGADWVLMGELVLKERRGFLGDDKVAFYATDPKFVPMMRRAIKAWIPTIYPASYFSWAEGME